MAPSLRQSTIPTVRSTSRYLDHIIHNPRVNGGGISDRRGGAGSNSPPRACANTACSNHPLDPATKAKHHPAIAEAPQGGHQIEILEHVAGFVEMPPRRAYD